MQIEPTWWITAVEAPIVAALFYMIHSLRKDLHDTMQSFRRDLHERIDRSDQRDVAVSARTRDELAAFKLEVARTYVPLSLIRDLDRRVSSQLLRIETKLEAATSSTVPGRGLVHVVPRGGHVGIMAGRPPMIDEEDGA